MSRETTCQKCGNDSFAKAKLSDYAKVMPTDRVFSTGSTLLLTFCSNCGEVTSLKVADPQKFVNN